MQTPPLTLTGNICFKIRFNTMHGDSILYWRVIAAADNEDEQEYLVHALQCNVPTRSDASYDEKAGSIKYHIAGSCSMLVIDETGIAVFS